jgi:hypothetical protein
MSGIKTTRKVAEPGAERRQAACHRHSTEGQTGGVDLNEPNSTASSNEYLVQGVPND